MSDTISVTAHAKVNLFLRVGEKTQIGYHEIVTVFQRLALADLITVRLTNSARDLTTSWDGLVPTDLGEPGANLAWRAAHAYAHATGWPKGWDIELTKRIPAGAGLGGGSSDAAAVLRALNTLAPNPLRVAELARIGTGLGADVPFFVFDASRAWGTGFGEVIEPVDPLPEGSAALLIPQYGVATRGAYAALDAWRERHGQSQAPRPARVDTWEEVRAAQHNDFEAPIFEIHPDLASARAWLEGHGAAVARLSGSGSTVFGIWPGAVPALEDPPGGFRLTRTATA